MHERLVAITDGAILVIDAIVLVIIAIRTIQAVFQGLRVMLLPSAIGHERRQVCGPVYELSEPRDTSKLVL
jgi:hypothetical protein